MAVKMRLRREGKRKQPFYRVVVADARSPRDGRFIEDIGYYHPLREPSEIEIKRERALYWLGEGVQPSDAVRQLLRVTGIWDEFRPGDVGRQRPAAVEAAAKAAAAAASAPTAASPAHETPAAATDGETAADDQARDEAAAGTADADAPTGDTSGGEASGASDEDADESTAEAGAS